MILDAAYCASSSCVSVFSINCGICVSLCTYSLHSSSVITFLAYASLNANIYIIDICTVNALVDATDISGPACVYITMSASLAIEEPLTLTNASVSAPFFLEIRRASLVSAVSPDWEINITRSPLPTIGSLYLNSDAISTVTLVLASFSMTYLPTIPACIAVPHATI